MSETVKSDMPSDTQDTFFEDSEPNSQFTKNAGNFVESQDFHLLDTGDSQDLEADLTDAPVNDSVVVNKESDLVEKTMDDENKQETDKNESVTEQVEEDEDFVQGTPPSLHSPSKKLTADLKSLKRRADLIDNSPKNDLQIKRNKVDDLEDTLESELEKMESETLASPIKLDKTEESNIIPETQDSIQDLQPVNEKSSRNLDLGTENSLEEECDLVNEAIDSIDDGDENQNDSNVANFADNDISNQNEILSADKDESKDLSKEIDFSEDVSFAENGDDKKIESEIAPDNQTKNVEIESKITEDVENKIEDNEAKTLDNENETRDNENKTEDNENKTGDNATKIEDIANKTEDNAKTDDNKTETDCTEIETISDEKKIDSVDNEINKNETDSPKTLENEIDDVKNETNVEKIETEIAKNENTVSEKGLDNQTEIKDRILGAQESKIQEPKPKEVNKSNSIEDALKELGGESDATESSKQLAEKESTESELLAALTDSDTNAEVDEALENKETPMEVDTDELSELKSKAKNDQTVKSRMSIEVIYDRSSLSSAKPAEIVEIDDDEEKIVLDSSQEDSKLSSETKDKNEIDKSDFGSKFASKDQPLTNGDDLKKEDLDTTSSLKSNESIEVDKIVKDNSKSETGVSNPPFFVISDSEGDSMLENKSTSESHQQSSSAKTLQVEKEFVVCVRLKCLVTIDENTKEVLGKEVLGVNCENSAEQMRNSDTSTSLADISGNDNKDGSPGSVTSATYPRFSIMSISTISSSTSSSSAGSLATKNSDCDKLFSVPKGPAKHTKKLYDEKSHSELDQLSKEWKNSHLVATSVLNFVNTELSGADLQNGVGESINERLKKIRSSTPEANKETPQRNAKKGRPPKRLQTRATRKRTKIVSMKTSPNVVDPVLEDSDNVDTTLKESKTKASGSSTPVKKSLEGLRNATHSVEQADELLGKQVFAKWSDNNYYAGKVIDKTKGKYKVNFLDGKSKPLIPEFIIPISSAFGKGLSVYTLTKDGDYGPCGMIVDIVETANKTNYLIEPDEGKRITVQIKDIFLTPDQAQVLKEEVSSEQQSLPSTPHSISKVTLDNMLDGKRRSRRNASTTHTPKSKKSLTSLIDKTSEDEPSGSGVILKSKEAANEKDGKTSDSNCSVIEEIGIHGVQKEIMGFANDQVATKGPQSRIKGKQRSRKKVDDQETINLLGPIPEPNSKIFEGMSFMLTCAALDGLDRYHTDTGTDSNSEVGTDNEAEWQSRPFVRDRLEQQLTAGGGKVYDNFDLLPPSEYENTKLITNVPNLTAKSLLCLSVGISAYNHMWVIRSCQNNKPVNPSEEKLPAGWSIDRRTYVEMFHRRDQKPLTHIIVVIPLKDECDKEFVSFWSRICENAGGTIKVVDNPEISFIEGTVVLTTNRCPLWVIEKAKGWEIPLVSTTWVVQSLIEGKILTYDGHERFMPF